MVTLLSTDVESTVSWMGLVADCVVQGGLGGALMHLLQSLVTLVSQDMGSKVVRMGLDVIVFTTAWSEGLVLVDT